MHQRYNKLKYHKLYHSIPISCAFALLLLNIVMINPTVNNSSNIALALDNSTEEPAEESIDGVGADKSNDANSISNVDIANVEGEGEGDGDGDAGIAPLADLTSDGVTLVWNSSDDPIQSTYGDSSTVLYRYNRFNVTADNIKQYQILANVVDNANGSNGNKLIGYTSTDSTIQNGSSIDAISNSNGIVGKDLTSTTTSQWGYTIADGEVTNETNLANLTYKAVPAASSSTIGKTEAVTSLNNRAFTIAFAANIADDKPAGSYRTNVEVSVVVEPKELTIADITYMQDVTPEICNATPYADTAGNNQFTLRDKRVTSSSEPGYQYTVAHIKNKNNEDVGCWMTQNLAIINKTISSADSDMTTGSFTVPASNISGYESDDQNHHKAYIDPVYGGYYNWYTATAGTGTASMINGNASSSICPKGWQLPVNGDASTNKSYAKLLKGINNGSTATVAPNKFTYSGAVGGSTLSNTTILGAYWSSTASSAYNAYSLTLEYTVMPSYAYGRRYEGLSVRCVAR